MADITLNHVQSDLNQLLMQRANHNGRTIEAEIIAILQNVLMQEPTQTSNQNLTEAIAQHFNNQEDFDLPIAVREPIREISLF